MSLSRLAVLLVVVCLPWWAGRAGAADPPEEDLLNTIQVQDRLGQKVRELAEQTVRETPNPRAAKQLQASSTDSGATDPVDSPALPELLSLAFDQGLVALGDNRSIRLGLSTFAFIAAVSPHMTTEQYDRLSWARRIGGAVTLGGLGEEFDRDGDGEPDEALEAKGLSDIVGWEVTVRVFGSRDTRETKVAGRVMDAGMLDLLGRATSDYAAFYKDSLAELELADGTHRLPRSKLENHLASPAVQDRLLGLVRREVELQLLVDDRVKDVQRSLVVSVVSSGVERKADLGPDELSFGLRAAWGKGPLDHTFNVDWSREEGLFGRPDPTILKAAYRATGEVLARWFGTPAKLSLSASLERYDDVPDAKHQTVAQVGGRLDLPLLKGVTVPVSVKWINHRDLFTGEDDVVGNVGFAIDFSDLRKGDGRAAQAPPRGAVMMPPTAGPAFAGGLR